MSSTVIGIPTEIKTDEKRVSLTPKAAEKIISNGNKVVVQSGAGEGAGFDNNQYEKAGAKIVETAEDVFKESKIIVKVKEPQENERKLLTPEHTLFTYLHLAADKKQTEDLISSNSTCIAFETVTDDQGSLPLLTPMSEVAGRMATQQGAKFLERPQNGYGILLGGVPGVKPANVIVLGGGVVGTQAAKMAAGLGANVTIFDISLDRLRKLDDIMPNNVNTQFSNTYNILKAVKNAHLIIGAVLVPGAKAPNLITKEMLKDINDGTVLVDVAVDQGGCFETTHPTTHKDPTYIIDNVLHYCVANIPGAVPATSTEALTNATISRGLAIACLLYTSPSPRD